MHKFGLLMALALAACATPASERLPMNQVAGTCDDRALASFVGQVAKLDTGLKMMRISRARSVRVVKAGDAVTMDYNAQRLTVQLDDKGRIASTKCG